MALYPIKQLKDDNKNPFFPFVTTDAVLKNNSDKTLQQILDDMYTKAQVDQKIGDLGVVLSFKDVVDTVDELPTSGMQPGWVYVVRNYPKGEGGTTHSVIWDGNVWEDLGESIDLDMYYSKAEVDSEISGAIASNNNTERQTTNTAIAVSLNAAKNYTDAVADDLDTHASKDLRDMIHGMRINAEGNLEYWDGTQWVEIKGGGGAESILPLPITNFQALVVNNTIKLKFSLPDDVNLFGVLIRGKTGEYPVDENDGAIILNANKEGGATIPTEVVDSNVVPGERKYYRAFPYNFIREHLRETGQQVSAIIKTTQNAPAAPTLANKTDTSIVLNSVPGNEYRMNNGDWQTSNAFLGLNPVTEYTFYARKRETETALASPESVPALFTTNKPPQEAPAAPELDSVTASSITLNAVTGVEYRRGSGAWQDSVVFDSLNSGTSYTFYARMKETETMGVSPSSPGAVFVTDKLPQLAPEAPELSNRTDTSIVLKMVSGNEYKLEDGDWQTSNAFLGLNPVTEYTFYARKRENAAYFASESSTGVTFTTMKPIPATPNTPTVQSLIDETVTLVIQEGCEYKTEDGDWQESNVFEDLTPGSTYTFYTRVAETETHEASASSFGRSVVIPKKTQAAPPAPMIPALFGSAATVTGVTGTEVSLNGALFYNSPHTFKDLDPETDYEAYARMKETPTNYASPVSEKTKFTTGEEDFSITYDTATEEGVYQAFENGPEVVTFIKNNKATFRNEVKVVAAYFDAPWSAENLFDTAFTTTDIILDMSMFNTSRCTNMRRMFANRNETVNRTMTILGLNNWDTSQVTNMSEMFKGVLDISSLDVGSWNTSKVTSMSEMFKAAVASGVVTASNFVNVSNWDTSQVTNMSEMFYSRNRLLTLDLSNFDTSNVTNMKSMFSRCSSLTSLDLSNFDTSNVNNMGSMFFNCQSLEALDVSNFDTSNVTNMSSMFRGCSSLTSLDLSNFDTSNVTNMREVFMICSSLTSLDLSNFDTSNVDNMEGMFYSCSSLTSLDLSNFDTSNVNNMQQMFDNCSSLTSLDLSSFDTSNVTNMNNMFRSCSNISTAYAQIQDDANKFNSSSNKPANVNFVVKP